MEKEESVEYYSREKKIMEKRAKEMVEVDLDKNFKLERDIQLHGEKSYDYFWYSRLITKIEHFVTSDDKMALA